ncbi:MAG: hypothetical protein IT168_04815 [Bryobacterales bacterium]|nr:hypothetical protein [Bryobacterales bacterium]
MREVPVFVLFLLLAIVIAWAASDARRRGKSPILVLIAVVLFFPFGLIAWLLFRPRVAGARG